MEYLFALSVRKFLADYMPEVTEVVLMRDGVRLSGKAKPFLTVDYLATNAELLAAERVSYEEIYRFQVGIRAQTINERLRLQEKIRTLLRRPDGIALYDDLGADTGLRFMVDVDDFTPLYNDDTSNDTDNHRGYFDISIRIFRDTGETTFTQ